MVDENKFDKRLIERNLDRGIISEQDLKSQMKNLPDEEANAQWVYIDPEATEISEASAVSDLPEGAEGSEVEEVGTNDDEPSSSGSFFG